MAPSPRRGSTSVHLNLCNKTDELINAAFVSYKGRIRGWVSKGWYSLKKDDCINLYLGEDYYHNVFVYGVNNYGEWTGKGSSFCIDEFNRFTIPNSDNIESYFCYGYTLKRVLMKGVCIRKEDTTVQFLDRAYYSSDTDETCENYSP